MLLISPRARVSRFCDFEESSRGGGKIIVEDGVVIDSFVMIKAAGGVGDIRIGRDSVIHSGCVLYVGNGLEIGENVLIAANCTIAPVNHAFADRSRSMRSQGYMPSRGGVVVEDDVWIGCNCAVLDGARLGRGCVIGAGAVVRGAVPPFAIAVGNPLRIIGERGTVSPEALCAVAGLSA